MAAKSKIVTNFKICKERMKLASPQDPNAEQDYGPAHPFFEACPKCKAEALMPCHFRMPTLDRTTLEALLTLSEAWLEAHSAQFEKFDNHEDMHAVDEAKNNVAWFSRLLEGLPK